MSIPDHALLELYLRFYDAEFRAREDIGSSLAPFIGALTLLAAGALYLTSTPLKADISPTLRGSFWCATVVGVVALIAGIALVIAALWSRIYEHVPSLGAIEKWRAENAPHHDANPTERPSLDERLRLHLCEIAADCASSNRTINRRRSVQAHWAKLATAVTLVAFLVAAIALAFARETVPENGGSQFILLGAPNDGRNGEEEGLGSGCNAADSTAGKDRVPPKGEVPRPKPKGCGAASPNPPRKRVKP